MTEPLPPAEPPELELQLVAYLDGELAPPERRRLEDLLARDETARRKLAELQRRWDLLDELERTEPDEVFTRSTLEMAAVAADADAQTSGQRERQQKRRRWLLATASCLGAAAAGFLIVAWFGPDPNRDLLRDLPVLENIESYQAAGDVQFLQRLREEGLFLQPVGEEEMP